MAMTFGVHAGQQNTTLGELVRLWRYADRSGFDWISVWDHFEESPPKTAAKYADGWNAPYVSPSAFARKSRVLDDWCATEGRDPKEVLRTVNVGFYMGADETSAKRKQEALAAQWGDRLEESVQGFLMGSPREAVDRIGEYERAGAARLGIALRAPFDWEALQAFTEEVMPAFVKKAAP